jgi:hypothetical protein
MVIFPLYSINLYSCLDMAGYLHIITPQDSASFNLNQRDLFSVEMGNCARAHHFYVA